MGLYMNGGLNTGLKRPTYRQNILYSNGWPNHMTTILIQDTQSVRYSGVNEGIQMVIVVEFALKRTNRSHFCFPFILVT